MDLPVMFKSSGQNATESLLSTQNNGQITMRRSKSFVYVAPSSQREVYIKREWMSSLTPGKMTKTNYLHADEGDSQSGEPCEA